MRPVVDLRDLPDRELGVALGGRQALVSQQFLDGPQVGTLLQHVRAEGVAQRMGVDLRRQSFSQRDSLDDPAHAPGRQAPCSLHLQVQQQRFG